MTLIEVDVVPGSEGRIRESDSAEAVAVNLLASGQ